MSKKEFITRFVIFILFSLVAPIVYITVRCDLFKVKQTVSFWFVIVIGILLLFVGVMIKYYLDGMKTKYSLFKQILEGVVKIILPIVFVLFGAIWFKSKLNWITQNINLLIEVIAVILGFETIAIVVNPLPKWAFENNVDGLVQITDKIFHKKGE